MPTKTASRKPAPQQGQSLVRFIGATGENRIQTVISEQIGVFQPHRVSLEMSSKQAYPRQPYVGGLIAFFPVAAMNRGIQDNAI
jgi:hypothetical protein